MYIPTIIAHAAQNGTTWKLQASRLVVHLVQHPIFKFSKQKVYCKIFEKPYNRWLSNKQCLVANLHDLMVMLKKIVSLFRK